MGLNCRYGTEHYDGRYFLSPCEIKRRIHHQPSKFATITLAAILGLAATNLPGGVWSKVLRFGAGRRSLKAHASQQIAPFMKGAAGGRSGV